MVSVKHFVCVVLPYCRSLLTTVSLGQILSLLICGTAVTSGLLQNKHVLVPTGRHLSVNSYQVIFFVFFIRIAYCYSTNFVRKDVSSPPAIVELEMLQ